MKIEQGYHKQYKYLIVGHIKQESTLFQQEYPHVRRGSDLPPDILFCPFKLI